MSELREWEYISYQIGQTTVLVAGCVRANMHKVDPAFRLDAYLALTEDYIPSFKAEHQWSPWDESEDIPNEVLLSSLNVLHRWIDIEHRSKVLIHCHSGSHRAPSLFGLYLLGYHPEQAQKIQASAQVSNPAGIAQWRDPQNQETWYSKPLECAQLKLDKYPYLKLRIQAIVNGTANRLDDLNQLEIPWELLSLDQQQEKTDQDIKLRLLTEAATLLAPEYSFDGKYLTHTTHKVIDFVFRNNFDFKLDTFPEALIFSIYRDMQKIIVVEKGAKIQNRYIDQLQLLAENDHLLVYSFHN